MTTTALILAAGKGTRMRSRLSKVLHPLCGRPMVGWVMSAAREAGCAPMVVVGHQAEQVRAALGPQVPTAEQVEQHGTGHAVQCAVGTVPADGVLVVLAGDTPLVRGDTLTALLAGHGDALCTVLTARITPEEAPSSGYGRLVRDDAGQAQRIVEAANADPEELQITEFNSGIYAFDARWLIEQVLPGLQPHPPKQELYLTDAIEAAARAGRLRAVCHHDRQELMGVNDRAALSVAEALLRARINTGWMLSGVTLRDPANTFIDADVTLGQDVELGPGVVLRGDTQLGEAVVVEPHCVLTDTRVAAGARIFAGSVCEGAVVGEGAKVGPMARLRQGTVLEAGVKVGNFVETKKATLRQGAKASHLSYLGDCEVGPAANIGAGTITCNYDGHGKHRTQIGPGAFIGSNSALVAPVVIGEGAIVGAGSVVTKAVPADALTVARGQQRNIEGAAPGLHRRNAKRAAKAKAAAKEQS